MAERKLPKLETGVRFPSPALSVPWMCPEGYSDSPWREHPLTSFPQDQPRAVIHQRDRAVIPLRMLGSRLCLSSASPRLAPAEPVPYDRWMLLEVTCTCGWVARGTEDEIVDQFMEHAWIDHNLRLTREAILAEAQQVS